MMRRIPFLFSLLMLWFGFVGFSGCGTPMRDGLPVAIVPNYAQVKVGETFTIEVTLSKPREKAGKMVFSIKDVQIVRPASRTADISVQPGQSAVYFSFQGVKAGRTTIWARLDDSMPVSTEVIVSSQ